MSGGHGAAAQQDSAAIAPAAPAPASYALTVTGGVGLASVAAQSQAEACASVQPPPEVVVRWTGTGIVNDGGAMATALGAVAGSGGAAQYPQLRLKAVVSYCAQARADAVAAILTPTAWFLCGNAVDADVSKAGALANSAALAARGVPTSALLHPATPLHE